jgi:hypothetical protein
MRKSIRAIAAALVVALVLPVATMAAWPVANRYAWVSQGYHSYHKANDIATYSGTKVVPMRSGRVVFAGWKKNCGGYQVWVSHGNRLYSAYYHLRPAPPLRGLAGLPVVQRLVSSQALELHQRGDVLPVQVPLTRGPLAADRSPREAAAKGLGARAPGPFSIRPGGWRQPRD